MGLFLNTNTAMPDARISVAMIQNVAGIPSGKKGIALCGLLLH